MASVAAIAILLNLLTSRRPPDRAPGLSGFTLAGAAMVVESWLNERATTQNRGTIFSVYQMVVFGGSTAGQLLMVITPPSDSFFFAIGAILYCLAVLPMALSAAQHPQPPKSTRIEIRAIYRNSPVSALGVFLVGLVNGAFGTLGAVYGQRIGLPVPTVAPSWPGPSSRSVVQFPLGRSPTAWTAARSCRRRHRRLLVGLMIVLFQPRAPASSSAPSSSSAR